MDEYLNAEYFVWINKIWKWEDFIEYVNKISNWDVRKKINNFTCIFWAVNYYETYKDNENYKLKIKFAKPK